MTEDQILEEELTDTEDTAADADEQEAVKTGDERENAIEWYTGHDSMTITLTQRRLRNKVMKLKEAYPDEIEIITDNPEVLCAHVPLRYLNIRRPREISEEQKARMREVAARNIAEGKLKPRQKKAEE